MYFCIHPVCKRESASTTPNFSHDPHPCVKGLLILLPRTMLLLACDSKGVCTSLKHSFAHPPRVTVLIRPEFYGVSFTVSILLLPETKQVHEVVLWEIYLSFL